MASKIVDEVQFIGEDEEELSPKAAEFQALHLTFTKDAIDAAKRGDNELAIINDVKADLAALYRARS